MLIALYGVMKKFKELDQRLDTSIQQIERIKKILEATTKPTP